ncbi:hypothetical protein HAZT_HAZT006988 [Hyalella azteca]|uniref:Calcineurin-like phosphoesterase domain-containing protein n=1 Tax=Hyalella azteca TaxID=294128 RepID=A0A6A0GVL7_HYAAZ|nr:hypothetical protein HAZT_HAZT006988 [Hyalella azteca]
MVTGLINYVGDLFDEGKWCSTEEFSEYVKRFSTIFALPNATQLIVVAGNHDIGFHYSINPALAGRFEVAFRTASVSAVSVRGVLFVGVNSMAMHGDDCFLCADATKKLKQLHKELQCRQGAGPCDAEAEKFLPADDGHAFSRPVLLQARSQWAARGERWSLDFVVITLSHIAAYLKHTSGWPALAVCETKRYQIVDI